MVYNNRGILSPFGNVCGEAGNPFAAPRRLGHAGAVAVTLVFLMVRTASTARQSSGDPPGRYTNIRSDRGCADLSKSSEQSIPWP